MHWACPEDRHRLDEGQDRLRCPGCGRSFECFGGIPLFTDSEDDERRIRLPLPALEELWELLQQQSADDAVREFCRLHGCSRNLGSADWKFFLPTPPDGQLLELGPGYGDDSADLVGDQRAVLIVPHLTNARILHKRWQDRRQSGGSVAVVRDLSRLPLADESVHAIAMEDAATGGFGLTNRSFAAVAAEWRRVLSPGGAVFLGLNNPLARLLGLNIARSVLASGEHPESFNRLVKRAASDRPPARLGLRGVMREMRRQGFGTPTIYAPLPSERKIEIVIPIEESHVVRYFLNNLVRKNSALVRAAVQAGNVLARLNLLRHFVPYFYLIYGGAPRESARDTA